MATLNVHYQDMKEEVLEQAKKVSLSRHKESDPNLDLTICRRFLTPLSNTKKSASLQIKSDRTSIRTTVSLFSK